MKKHSRRQFLYSTSQAAAVALMPSFLLQLAKENGFSINIFSKHLQWLDYAQMAEKIVALGFDGVDLTVRPGGHVEPARVQEDLPKAVKQLQNAGLQVETITTAIESLDSPFAKDIIQTAGSLGIRYYRMGWIKYDTTKTIEQDLKRIKKQLQDLVDINKQYNIKGAYQNHAGNSFGASIWDLWMVLKEMNSPYLGSQYDLRHAMVEGLHAWENGFELLVPFINTLTVKDFHFKNQTEGEPLENVPLGEGIVKWEAFFKNLKEKKMQIPITLHCEYPLGGAENGNRSLTLPESEVLKALKQDLIILKSFIKKA
ncbi:MAG: sugar phosphate isomerase/epimerase [Saprospiraceae bacterium]|nr:sugar phosphate isomerase/epimerase [Saprospiraceae bacterium]